MPEGVLRIQGEAGVRVADIREYLGRLEHAYNSVYAFERAIVAAERLGRHWPTPLFMLTQIDWPIVSARAARLPSAWPPLPEAVASAVLARDRLVLRRARFESPGFWEFLGTLNPLEVLRQYLNDRHERRKDGSYREAAEARRLELENRLLENRVIRERMEMARQLGASDADLAPLLNELVYRPLRALNRAQDEGIIEVAELIQERANRG
jgi:hypothetical protein